MNDEIIALDVIGITHAKTIVEDYFTREKGVVLKETDLRYDKTMLITIKKLFKEHINDFPTYLQVWIEHRLSIIEDII